MNYIG